MYRVLMVVASPKRLAAGGRRRWMQFHTGVDYEVVVGEGGTEGRMTFPPNLYDRLAFRATLKAFEAAYRASGAPKAYAEILSMNATEVHFRMVWYPETQQAR